MHVKNYMYIKVITKVYNYIKEKETLVAFDITLLMTYLLRKIWKHEVFINKKNNLLNSRLYE